ncbi:MAG: RagB/SusD family nutrient uptake outer membrane protein [Bacteroidota bacterium]
MNFNKLTTLGLLCILFVLSSCSFDEQTDPNGPSINSVLTNASLAELNLLVSGIEAQMRNGFGTFVTSTGTIARELYKFDADPRNTEDLLGKEDLIIDNNTFYLTAPFSTRYRVIKNCNILLEALDNTNEVSETEKDGYRGFANTIKGLMLSQVLGMLGDNGIRIDVADPENLGPYVSQSEGYTQILSIMNLGNEQLNRSTFSFALSSGFSGFDTPETFGQFNRALTARIATQGELYEVVLDILNTSFFDLNGDITVGPTHVFSTQAGDLLNPLFKTPGQSGDQIIVHSRMVDDAETGDARLSKFALRPNPTSQDGLNSDYETALYATSTSPISIIRNEELILIYVEASIQGGRTQDAVDGINTIRMAHGLPAYSGGTSMEDLIDEMLFQRRYSLWGEGHHMLDMRRYGRLNDTFLPIDRPGDDVFTQFPIPLSEGV